ncbi:uncharacterized protein LOC144874401 [Branchiostoma floridae x Branchiostoma japonicum]
MDSSTTYIDTRIANNFNPDILPPGGWHTAEVCGESKTTEQPTERIWNTVLVTEPPGSRASQPKHQQQQQRAPTKQPELPVLTHRNPHDQFSFEKVNNWTISQIDDSMGKSSMRRSFPQKAIVEPSAVQAAPSPASSAPFPQSPPQLNDKKVRFSLSDEMKEKLSRSLENMPFDLDENRPPAPGGIQAVSFNAEKLQGWTIMNLRETPLPYEMLEKENQIPGEMFITYVEDGKLKIVFLQKQTNILQKEYEKDIIRLDEYKNQNGVHSNGESDNSNGQKSFSESSQFIEDTRRESQTINGYAPSKGFINHGDSGKLVQTNNNRRESQVSNASNDGPPKGLLKHQDSMMMIQPANNRRESNNNVVVTIGPAESSSNRRESVQMVQPNDGRRDSQLNGTTNGFPGQKEPVNRPESHFSLAGSVKDWSWEPRDGEQTTQGVPSTSTAGAEQQEETPPVATQVLVNGQHYYVTKEDNAEAPRSTLRKIDSSPPSTILPVSGPEQQPTGPPDRPPPSYEVLDTVPKLPLEDNVRRRESDVSSVMSSVRASISATDDVLVQVTKGEGKSLHVNVRPPEGMSAGDIKLDLDLAVLSDSEEKDVIADLEAIAAEESKAEHRREEQIAEELGEGQTSLEYRREEPIIEELGEEQLIVADRREEDPPRLEDQLKEILRKDEAGSVRSSASKESRRKKKKAQMKGSTRSNGVESVTSSITSENHRNTEKKKMRWSNLSRQQRQPQGPVENGERDANSTETIDEASQSSGKRSYKKSSKQTNGQSGLARLTSKFKKSQKDQR